MVSVVEVKSKRQIRDFVDYPNWLYRDVPQFVPATYDDDLQDWHGAGWRTGRGRSWGGSAPF